MTKYNEKYIIDEYLKGKTAKEIAVGLGTYNTTIRRILIRNGIKTRSISEHLSKRDNMFTNLEDPETQYWLGILASDGNVGSTSNRIVLQLSYKDAYLVDAFAKFTNSSAKDIVNKKYNIVERRCAFRSKAIKESLVSYGIVPAKSKILKMYIPITFNFLLGVIDGDGYVRKYPTKTTVEIASASKLFSMQVYTFLKNNGIHCTLKFTNNIYIVGIYSKKDVLNLYFKLYETAVVFLKRKRNNFGPLLEKSI